MFFLLKLNSFNADGYFLQLFYKTDLQSILCFGLICVFGNICSQDQDKLQCVIKMVSRVLGYDQMSALQLCKYQILNKADHILNDFTHPLHNRFQLSYGGKGRN